MRRRIAGSGVNAIIGISGRSRDMRRAVSPDSVNMQRNFASMNCATSMAASVIAPPCVRGFAVSGAMRSRPWVSVESTIRAMVSTTTTDPTGAQTTEQLPRTLFTLGVTQAQAQKILFASANGELAFGLMNQDSKVVPDAGANADNLFK